MYPQRLGYPPRSGWPNLANNPYSYQESGFEWSDLSVFISPVGDFIGNLLGGGDDSALLQQQNLLLQQQLAAQQAAAAAKPAVPTWAGVAGWGLQPDLALP